MAYSSLAFILFTFILFTISMPFSVMNHSIKITQVWLVVFWLIIFSDSSDCKLHQLLQILKLALKLLMYYCRKSLHLFRLNTSQTRHSILSLNAQTLKNKRAVCEPLFLDRVTSARLTNVMKTFLHPTFHNSRKKPRPNPSNFFIFKMNYSFR